jgi:hypothetical protein
LPVRQRLDDPLRQGIGARIDDAALAPPAIRELGAPPPPIIPIDAHPDEALPLERSEQTAQITRIQTETLAELLHVGTVGTDLPEHACFAEWAAAPEVVLLESADPFSNRSIESPHPLDVARPHDL